MYELKSRWGLIMKKLGKWKFKSPTNILKHVFRANTQAFT